MATNTPNPNPNEMETNTPNPNPNEDLNAKIAKQDKRLNDIQSLAMLIFIVANCYFVFQGVILTIVGHGAQNLKVDGNFSASKMSRVIADISIKLCNGAKGEDEEGIATVEGEANGGGDEEGIEAVQL
uniref:Uncharacterized protein n=1 Tax=Fagus sylvatica TaxID=28930 RepID=A0A2N9H276_FAGSY